MDVNFSSQLHCRVLRLSVFPLHVAESLDAEHICAGSSFKRLQPVQGQCVRTGSVGLNLHGMYRTSSLEGARSPRKMVLPLICPWDGLSYLSQPYSAWWTSTSFRWDISNKAEQDQRENPDPPADVQDRHDPPYIPWKYVHWQFCSAENSDRYALNLNPELFIKSFWYLMI